MKVLVADKFEQSGLDGLKALDAEVIFDPALKDETLEAKIKETGAEILVVRSTKVTEPMLHGSQLGLVIRAGAGYNTIAVDAAAKNGIAVANCPGKNSIAVAELAFGLMLALDRKIPDNVAELRCGNWKKGAFSKAKGLYGGTLGLIGLGNIGQEMIPRAKAFGMCVVGCSRWLTADIAAALGIARAENPVEVAERSDYVSVHVALNSATQGMLGKSFFEAMKPGSALINTSRAEVVDSDALMKALDEGKIYAGLDVFEGEPAGAEGTYDGPLKSHPRVYCTHHIGASTEQAQEAVAAETVRIVGEFMRSGKVLNQVGGKKGGTPVAVIVVRHATVPNVVEGVIECLAAQGIGALEIETVPLAYEPSAITEISLDKSPTHDGVHAIKHLRGVYDATTIVL